MESIKGVPNEENQERQQHLNRLIMDALQRDILRYREHMSALKSGGEQMKPEALESQLTSCAENIKLLEEEVTRLDKLD